MGTPSCWRGHRARIRGDNQANNIAQRARTLLTEDADPAFCAPAFRVAACACLAYVRSPMVGYGPSLLHCNGVLLVAAKADDVIVVVFQTLSTRHARTANFFGLVGLASLFRMYRI